MLDPEEGRAARGDLAMMLASSASVKVCRVFLFLYTPVYCEKSEGPDSPSWNFGLVSQHLNDHQPSKVS